MSRQGWDEALERLRNDDTSAYAQLYSMARSLGRAILARKFPGIPADARDDLIHDVLAHLLQLDHAPQRGLFIVALVNRALDYVRRADFARRQDPVSQSRDDESDDPLHAFADGDDVEARALARDEMSRALASLPERDRQVVTAVALGEDRDEIAARFGTSRNNVDQIVVRVRKKAARRREV